MVESKLTDLVALFTEARDTIFEQFDSLAQDITLIEKPVSGFNYSTPGVTSVETTTVVRGILLQSTSMYVVSQPGYSDRVVVKSGDVEPSLYDKLQLGGKTYHITDYSYNRFVTSFNVAEVS